MLLYSTNYFLKIKIERYETAGRPKQITQSTNGSRHERKLKKYSESFNQNFKFFLEINRKGLITFCGSVIEIEFDVNGFSSKDVFKKFEDGFYSKKEIIKSRHPNIVKSVLIGKKGWGLWRKQWSEGIRDGSFTRYEILEEFSKLKIEIPDCFMKEFLNAIYK